MLNCFVEIELSDHLNMCIYKMGKQIISGFDIKKPIMVDMTDNQTNQTNAFHT